MFAAVGSRPPSPRLRRLKEAGSRKSEAGNLKFFFMKRAFFYFLFVRVFYFSLIYLACINRVNCQTIYPAPEGIKGAEDYTVEVNGKPLFVYNVLVSKGDAAMTYFDMSDPVTIKVTSKNPIHSAYIGPKSYGIIPDIKGNTITFTLREPRKIVICIDPDEWLNTYIQDTVVRHLGYSGKYPTPRCRELHIFANSIETTKPDPKDPNVIYYGPGVSTAGDIWLKDNQTLYIAGGAYVYGRIRANGKHNIKVLGRGIIDNPIGVDPGNSGALNYGLLRFYGCSDAIISGIIMVRSKNSWLCVLKNSCRNITIDNVKIFNQYPGGTDGIDICSCQDITVNDCFVRAADDNIVLKGDEGQGNVERIRITNCSIWSDGCRSLRIGPDNPIDKIDDIVWKNIDIIKHIDTSHPVIGIEIGDHASASNILFENIRIEENGGTPFIMLYVGPDYYMHDSVRGHLKNVTLKNVNITDGPYPSLTSLWPGAADGILIGIYGFDPEHQVENVTFENCHMLGKLITKPEDGNIQIREFAKNIRFIPPADGTPAASFNVLPHDAVAVGQPVKFDASGSLLPESEIASYTWTFGDGSSGSGKIVTHEYSKPGRYLVELTLQDSKGKTSKVPAGISVFHLRPPDNPGKTVNGLEYEYFSGDTLNEKGVCKSIKNPRLIENKQIDLYFKGYIDIPSDGVYGFKMRAKGGDGYLKIGDQIVVNPYTFCWNVMGFNRIGLKKGKHAFTMYINSPAETTTNSQPLESNLWTNLESFFTNLEWEGPGFTFQPIPESALRYNTGLIK